MSFQSGSGLRMGASNLPSLLPPGEQGGREPTCLLRWGTLSDTCGSVSEATLGRCIFPCIQPQGGQPCRSIPFDTNQNDCLSRAFHFLPVCSQGQGKLVSGVSFELKLAELFISFKPYTDAFELSLCWRAFFFVVSAHHFLPSHCFEQVL